MKLLIPHKLDKFPKTEDLLLLLTLKDMFGDDKVQFWDLNSSETHKQNDNFVCLLAGEFTGFLKVLSSLQENLENVLCPSVKITENEMAECSLELKHALKTLIKTKRLTAADSGSALVLSSGLGMEAPEVTGSIFSFNRFTKIPRSFPRPVYFSDWRLSQKENRKVYEAISANQEVLFVANDFKDLEGGALPGLSTLVSPLFPQSYAAALASASQVFSSSPVAFEIANTQSISFTQTGTGNTFSIADNKNNLAAFLSHNGISLIKLVERNSTTVQPLVLASISDSNYYPFLRGWILNILQFVTEPVFHVLGLDENVKVSIQKDFPDLNIQVHLLKDLWSEKELPEIMSRSVGVRAFSSKPRLIKKALTLTGLPVVYTDSDVYFFSSPKGLIEELGQENVLLFPHWNEHKKEARHDGLFNAGMVVAASTAIEFLDWWSDACFLDCRVANHEGSVGDQGYLDFAHLYFKGVKSYDKADQDVARWNLRSLGVKRETAPDWVPTLANGSKVKSFHAAFIDGLGLFESKAVWDQLCSFFSSHAEEDKNKHFIGVTLAQQSRHWVGLSRAFRIEKLVGKNDGIAVKSKLRDILFYSPVKAFLDFVFGLKKKEHLCESAQTPTTLEADTPWCQFQRKRFLDSNATEPQKKIARAVNSRY